MKVEDVYNNGFKLKTKTTFEVELFQKIEELQPKIIVADDGKWTVIEFTWDVE